MRILIFGLPGSGKSTLAEKLANALPDHTWYNADRVREEHNDWDFSDSGRIRQAERMLAYSKQSNSIIDFVCPFRDQRLKFNTDIKIWMNTIDEGRFSDTNKVFEIPAYFEDVIEINSWDEVDNLVRQICSLTLDKISISQ